MSCSYGAIVADIGSYMTRCGPAPDTLPSSVFPTLVSNTGSASRRLISRDSADSTASYSSVSSSRRTSLGSLVDADSVGTLVGFEAAAMNSVYGARSPMEDGIVTNWSDMDKLLDSMFLSLRLPISAFEELPFLFSERSPAPAQLDRERLLQYVFESYSPASMSFVAQPVLALYSYGRTSGIVIDSGEHSTRASPVYEGFSMPHLVASSAYGGKFVTETLRSMIRNEETCMPSPTGRISLSSLKASSSQTISSKVVRRIKESLAFASSLFEAEDSRVHEEYFELPDGQMIMISSERYRCTEPLFEVGFEDKVYTTTSRLDTEIKSRLLDNCVLVGGNSMINGYEDRLYKELRKVLPVEDSWKLLSDDSERSLCVWKGGSVLSTLSSFHDICVSQDEYYEVGPRIVHWKCF